jgi:hypothetical protein
LKLNFVHTVVIILVILAAGCGGKNKEERLMERARAEFADPGRKTFQHFLKEKFGVNLMFVDVFDRVYNSCETEECRMFEHVKFPLGGPEYWAIEIVFTGKDVVTNERVHGTAMMLYVNVLVEEGKRDDYLGWVMTGTTSEEIASIEKLTRDMFTTLKRML